MSEAAREAALAAVLAANAQFYRALSLADLGAMQRVWLDRPEAVCGHPGQPAVYGWPAIRESWRQIFANQGPLRVWASDAQVRLYGRTAEVLCLENIDTGRVAGAGLIQTRAVNLFRLEAGEWKLLEHHASPAAGGGRPVEPFSHN